MNCPQCGSDGYTVGKECRVCGLNSDQLEQPNNVQKQMPTQSRDLLNGVGLGCSVLCFLWFFVESIVFALAAHDPAKWSIYGPIMSVGIPLLFGLILYLSVRVKRSAFSRGVGISLLITLVLAILFAYIGERYRDNKPPANGSGNGFE